MSNDKYYDGSFFEFIAENNILIDIRERSFGRTSWWINKAIRRAERCPQHRFIYFRRTVTELDEVITNGFCKNLLMTSYYGNWYKKRGYNVEVSNYKIYLTKDKNKTLVGYMKSFNGTKGVELNDVDLIIFDEFIALLRSQYKGGYAGAHEPKLFEIFMHTVFRRRNMCWAVLLGNQDTQDSPTNPYNEHYRIPYKAKKYKRADIGLIYRQGLGAGDTGGTAAQISRADAKFYAQSVCGEINDGIDALFIETKSPNAQYICAIKYQSTFLTLWFDDQTGIIYTHDNYKVDKHKPFYTAFADDMSVCTNLLIASQFPQLKTIKQKFYLNMLRYNNGACANKMFDIIDIIK